MRCPSAGEIIWRSSHGCWDDRRSPPVAGTHASGGTPTCRFVVDTASGHERACLLVAPARAWHHHMNQRPGGVHQRRTKDQRADPCARSSVGGPGGEQVGIVRIDDALRLAEESDLDLVEVAPMAKPPVCKLMDYGKFSTRPRSRRVSHVRTRPTVIKEMKLRPEDRSARLRHEEGHIERFLKGWRQSEGHDHVPWPGAVRLSSGYRLLAKLAEGGHR